MIKEIEVQLQKLEKEYQNTLNNILVLKENLLIEEKKASFIEGQKAMANYIKSLPTE